MRRFSSQYLITNTGPVLKRAIVTTDDDGLITSIEDTGGDLKESQSIEFHNGIIIPGFANCHCHLELSHMKGIIPGGTGLGNFIEKLKFSRDVARNEIISASLSADNTMYRNGVVICADICNTSHTFSIKQESRIKYHNLIEIFGIDPAKAEKRLNEALVVAQEASAAALEYNLTPHSSYSVSLSLFRLIKKLTEGNNLTSFHFMETGAEKDFLEKHSGPLIEAYKRAGLLQGEPDSAPDHATIVLDEITSSGNLILVHNTFTDKETINKVKRRKNLFWCLCPGSNLYIEQTLPPVRLLLEENCKIVIGTDSLASNDTLNILDELKILQLNFPDLQLTDLIKWSTINGAAALGEEKDYGSIEPGKKPGLMLIENADLRSFKLTQESTVTRLI